MLTHDRHGMYIVLADYISRQWKYKIEITKSNEVHLNAINSHGIYSWNLETFSIARVSFRLENGRRMLFHLQTILKVDLTIPVREYCISFNRDTFGVEENTFAGRN